MTVCDGGEGGGGGVQNSFNLCDVIYVRPQRRSSLKRLVTVQVKVLLSEYGIYGSLNPGTIDKIDGVSLHPDNCLYNDTSSSSVAAFISSPTQEHLDCTDKSHSILFLLF